MELLTPACQVARQMQPQGSCRGHSQPFGAGQWLPSSSQLGWPSTHLLLGGSGQAAQGLFTHWHWPAGQHHVAAGVQDCCTGVCQEQQVPSQMMQGRGTGAEGHRHAVFGLQRNSSCSSCTWT